ncbi:MAG: 50S ribosomal protein L5 [Elusimicrobia bacterium]|nr:50S ribosomal protein L5 [Elusimicrobiota bacterium]
MSDKEKPQPAPRLRTHYQEKVVPALMSRLEVENPFQIPRLVKIVINMSANEAKENIQALDSAKEELAQIAGQAPQLRRAKKSISNFKLREGMPIALRVTLRGVRMYEFLDRLISTAIPRIRDFRGLEPSGFDGLGNYNLGLKEQLIFPEVNVEKSPKTRGMNITFVTSCKDLNLADPDGAARELLGLMGMPFKKRAPVAAPAAART